MPYPNEHACRLKSPDLFQPDSFRRGSRAHEGKRYDVIMGRLKATRAMAEQAYRYPKDIWTEAEARKHCQDHDGILFEPASDGGSSSLLLNEQSCEKERKMQRSYVLQAFVETPWAILPDRLAVLEEIVIRHASGEKLDADEVQTRIHGARRPADRRVASVAVLPLFGTIFPRANLLTDVSGATSAERFGNQFQDLVNDPEIGAIVLDVDSPGGQVGGIEELSAQIYAARGTKPVVAVANHLMASAAYWIGTAADEVVVAPSGEVGSIGVFSVHKDFSKALDNDGIKVTLISEGKYKVEGNPYEPLAEEARTAIHTRVGEYYDAFVRSVARNRGVKASAVKNGFGEGRVVGAQQAIEEGMADRIGTLNETIIRLLDPDNLIQALDSVNAPSAAISSESQLSDVMEREAQTLREKITHILRKETQDA